MERMFHSLDYCKKIIEQNKYICSEKTFSDARWKHHMADATSFFTQSPAKYTDPSRYKAPGCN